MVMLSAASSSINELSQYHIHLIMILGALMIVSGWIMLIVMGMRIDSKTVLSRDGVYMIVIMVMLLV